MELIADLHIHGRYSRACSKQLSIASLEKWARVKGAHLLGTGDFTHPEWIKELKNELIEDGKGILRTKTGFPFILQTEISLMYSQGGKGRKIHIVLLAPDFKTVDIITQNLLKIGRIDYDGRPIFGMEAPRMVKLLKAINEKIEIIPAHAWTPWFGVFGSKSGFNSLNEAFLDQVKHIYAIETGLSSDPPMNWRLKELDKIQLISSSDSHSFWPWRIAREATIFDIPELNYNNIIKAIRTGEGLKLTIEVNPNYGKYHYDGHRNCNISMSPQESSVVNNICPVCKKPLTIGVLNRVEELANRPEGTKLLDKPPFLTLIPLHEIISAVVGSSVNSKKVWEIYNKMIEGMGNEYNILLNASKDQIAVFSTPQIAEAVIDNRAGEIMVEPGYDGEYGVLNLGDKKQKKLRAVKRVIQSQKGLDSFL